ncbi:VOC family protein [Microlunatus sp. Gsoil 973]|uniref:VOC family protein n=1 Tax=Microlunatus sp. Gsoil 973 TaxID=2672569 RepID=UPI0018A81736|nr:VOC family protein [Microlunatus sp. Gsoil 973]
MAVVVQVNFVVADLERSRDFYQRLGFSFRSRSRLGVDAVEAWVADNGGVTVVLHSPEFARWWDAATPGPTSGGPQIDLELESADALQAVVDDLHTAGGTIGKEPTDMTWGQRFAIVVDPDGYRIGLKAPSPKGAPPGSQTESPPASQPQSQPD